METESRDECTTQKESYLRIYGALPITVMEAEYERMTERIQELLFKKTVLYEAIEERRQCES